MNVYDEYVKHNGGEPEQEGEAKPEGTEEAAATEAKA